MALQLDDPLSQSIYGLGLQQTTPWDPTQEAARKDQAWGQTQQKVGERYSRAGLTGSSQELGDLSNTAKNFELDWGERAPKQRADALASVLPIQNFRRGVAQDVQSQSNADRTYDLQKDQNSTALWGNLLASSGLPTWLSSLLFGTGTPAVSGSSTGGLAGQGVNALLKMLFGGSGNDSSINADNLSWLANGNNGLGDWSWLDNTDYLGGVDGISNIWGI